MTSRTTDPVGFRVHGRYLATKYLFSDGDEATYDVLDEHMKQPASLRLHTGSDQSQRARHLAVAALVQRAGHPNLETVLAHGESPEGAYVVTEGGSGHRLTDELRDGQTFSPNRAFVFLEPIVSALAAAHAVGLAHGNLGPDQVLLVDDGRVEVTGFTVPAAGPEDTQADVVAVGALLHRLLSGEPFVAGAPVPASAQGAALPGYLTALITRATSLDDDQRPASASALLPMVRSVGRALLDGMEDSPALEARIIGRAGVRAPALVAEAPAIALPAAPQPPPKPTAQPTLSETTSAVTVPTQDRRERASAPPTKALPTRTLPTMDPPEPTQPETTLPETGQPTTTRSSRANTGRRVVIVLALVAAAWGVWAALAPGEKAEPATVVDLPRVIGMTVPEARQALQAAGLRVGISGREFSDTVPTGGVTAMAPSSGPLRTGETVTLVVSQGSDRPTLPDLTGLDLAAAQRLIVESGLTVGAIVNVSGSDAPAGQVVASIPAARSRLDRGTVVALSVSNGRQTFAMPDFRDWTLFTTRAGARRFGLEVKIVGREASPDGPSRRVLRQSPAPGTTVTGGSVVKIVISR